MRGFTYRELGNHGRLGNQLWQIASTAGLAKEHEVEFGFPDWAFRPWFNVPDGLFEIDISQFHSFYPDYLQDLGFIRSVVNEAREWFSASALANAAIDSMYPYVDWEDVTAIHVRRGDYLGLPQYHPVCPIEYYETALYTVGADVMMVFSDDQEWCKSQPLFERAIFATGSEVEDLLTMARCSRFVIANSTFSWWGAWLANVDPRGVAYPERWYGPEVPGDYRLMINGLGWNGIEFLDSWGIG